MAVAARAMAEETLRHFANFPGHYNNTPDSHFSRQDWRIDLRVSGLRVQASPANQSFGIPTGCRMRTCIWEARALSALKLRRGMPLSGKPGEVHCCQPDARDTRQIRRCDLVRYTAKQCVWKPKSVGDLERCRFPDRVVK